MCAQVITCIFEYLAQFPKSDHDILRYLPAGFHQEFQGCLLRVDFGIATRETQLYNEVLKLANQGLQLVGLDRAVDLLRETLIVDTQSLDGYETSL